MFFSSKVRWWLAVSLLFVLALGWRLHHLDHESLFMDEIRQVSYYTFDPVTIVREAASQQQPPLDYWIGHFFFEISNSDFFARLPAALFGAGSVLLLVLYTGRITSPAAALLAGLIMSLLPFHVYFSQEARPYMIAIFFLLAVLLAMDRLLGKARVKLIDVALLSLLATLFLFSRTLVPLVVVCVLIGTLSVLSLARRFGFDPIPEYSTRALLLSVTGLGIAVLVYLPVLKRILDMGRTFAPGLKGDTLSMLRTGIERFDPTPIWSAFVTQMDPIGWGVGSLMVLGLLSTRRGSPPALKLLTVILPLTALLHLFVFQANTFQVLRPPYAWYLLPLCLALAARGFWVLWQWSGGTPRGRVLKPVLVGLMVSAVAFSGAAGYEMKQRHLRTDWKGLGAYLTTHVGSNDYLLFDTLGPPGAKEPDFCGFGRYYRGRAPGTPLRYLPEIDTNLPPLTARPVLILFQYRDYRLTAKAPFPIMPRPSGRPFTHLDSLGMENSLELKTFDGVSVLSPRNPSGNFSRDLLGMLETLVQKLPADSALVDLHSTAAYLAISCGEPSAREHLLQAERLLPVGKAATSLTYIAQVKAFLENTRIPPRIACGTNGR